MEERENPTLQIEISRVSRECDETDKENNKHFCNKCKFKEKNGVLIIEMHFFGIFIVLMIPQK